MVTLVVTAILSIAASTVLALHQQPSSLHRASHPSPTSRLAVAAVGLSYPIELRGRVELYDNEQVLAAERAAQAAQAAKAARAAKAAKATPRPPAAAPAQPQPAPTTYPAGSVQAIIQQAFAPLGSAAVAWGLRVARCESGYDPRAYNPAGPYYGLFQFLMSTFQATPYGSGNIYDPATNANAAAWKYAHGGASAWGCN